MCCKGGAAVLAEIAAGPRASQTSRGTDPQEREAKAGTGNERCDLESKILSRYVLLP